MFLLKICNLNYLDVFVKKKKMLVSIKHNYELRKKIRLSQIKLPFKIITQYLKPYYLSGTSFSS